MNQFPLDRTFLVSLWLEALVYGFFLCLFCATLWVSVTWRRGQDGHSKVMFHIGIVFFTIATMHLGMNCYRLIEGFVVHVNTPGGAVGYLGALAPWHHVFKDTLYATQEILGDAVAIYRTWIIWGRDWRIILLPTMLFIVSCVSGYAVCGLYPSQPADETVFDPSLTHWISTFYAIAVVQSAITTGLMAFKLWQMDRLTAGVRMAKGNLLPVLRILVESASLQFVVETILLGLYAANNNAQYILLEIVTPLVGITFAAITLRITLQMSGRGRGNITGLTTVAGNGVAAALGAGPGSGGTHSYGGHGHQQQQHPVATIGSIPMRPIAINIMKDVESQMDDMGRERLSNESKRGIRKEVDEF